MLGRSRHTEASALMERSVWRGDRQIQVSKHRELWIMSRAAWWGAWELLQLRGKEGLLRALRW